MKKPRKLTLKEKLSYIEKAYDDLRLELSQQSTKLYELEKINEELKIDKRWLKTLAQEMSSSINNGSKEGSFPRR